MNNAAVIIELPCGLARGFIVDQGDDQSLIRTYYADLVREVDNDNLDTVNEALMGCRQKITALGYPCGEITTSTRDEWMGLLVKHTLKEL